MWEKLWTQRSGQEPWHSGLLWIARYPCLLSSEHPGLRLFRMVGNWIGEEVIHVCAWLGLLPRGDVKQATQGMHIMLSRPGEHQAFPPSKQDGYSKQMDTEAFFCNWCKDQISDYVAILNGSNSMRSLFILTLFCFLKHQVLHLKIYCVQIQWNQYV